MTQFTQGNGHVRVKDVKSAARGRWRDVLTDVGGFHRDDLDGRHHPCPRCGGSDRFRFIDEDTGAVLCNQCFSGGNGDGLAAIQWRNDWTFGETIKAVAGYLGIDGGERKPTDIVADVARLKRMPLESFQAFGAHRDQRGKVEVARVPMFDEKRQPCSHFDLSDITPEFSKGFSAKGMPVGLFVAKWPEPGDVVLVTEGVKDAAALHGLGFLAVGLPGSKMPAKFARVFAGCHVVIVPDRDSTGEDSARITAARLKGVAASVRIATLPGELKSKDGDGVREVLASKDGELMLRQAIADATTWEPATETDSEDGPDDEDDWTSLREAKGRTERANSRRFLKQHGERVRFCHPWSKWLVWDGTRWQIDDCGAVLRLAMATADSVWMDAKEHLTKDVVDFAVATSGHGKLAAMLKLAAADVPVAVDGLDANPWLLNCLNGTVDLRTGELRPHRREDHLTNLCPTNFNPDAGSYHFDRFLEGVFDGHGPTIDFMQRFFGYCLTGDVSEQILAVFHGVGSNGKSTLLNAIQDTLGPDYSMAAPPALLTAKKSERHPTELADLFGQRFVVSQETEDGNRLAESLVKQITGGDRIRARWMRENFWQFSPTHKLVLCTNHKPRVKGTDHAIWRRLVLIPFARKFWNPDKGETGPAELQQDKELPAKLKAEAEGILAWMVRGCLEWQRGGLLIPESVRAATAEYRSEQDTLGRFVETCCLRNEAVRVKFPSLYGELEKWCNEGGDNLPSKRFVGSWLKENGFTEKSSNGRWYHGIALKAEATS
jgi:putative DNA primase/helicase